MLQIDVGSSNEWWIAAIVAVVVIFAVWLVGGSRWSNRNRPW